MKTEQVKLNARFFLRSFINGLFRIIVLAICTGTIFVASSVALGQIPNPSPEKQTDSVKPTPTPTASPDVASKPDTESEKQDEEKQDDPAVPKKPKRGSLVFAPIPILSPAVGSGLILGVGYIFKLNPEDKTSPPSTIGAGGAFTSNGTRGLVLGGRFYFSENKYQTAFAFGKGRANIDFFGIGRIPGREPVSVLIEGSGTFFFGEFLVNAGKKIFIGPRYQYRKLSASIGGTPTPGGFEIPPIDLKSNSAAIGFHVQRDLRDNSFYPRKGSIFNFTGDFFAKPLGSRRNYQTYKASYNGYHSVGEKQVIAYRGSACSASDNTPFYDLCFYGANSDLRGYTTGEFQNHRMFATQVEYRRELPYRLGFVAFAGVGGVARYWDKFRFDELLPAAGVGLRFKLDKTNHINYRIDLGFGRNGHTLSLSVTEAF